MAGIEALTEGYGRILNNEQEEATRPTRRSINSIINLIFTTLDVTALDTWIIDWELSTRSDHEAIVFDMTSLDEIVGRMGISQEVIGSSIKCMSDEVKKETPADWFHAAARRPRMGEESYRNNIEDEADWI